MGRSTSILKLVSLSFALAAAGLTGSGCDAQTGGTGGATTTTTTSSSSSSSSGTGGTGGTTVDIDGGTEDAGSCTSLSAQAKRTPLDIVFLIDKSGSMTGAKWIGTTVGLTLFFNDPASAGISAGMVYFPTNIPYDCDPTHYQALDVPIDVLPNNAFALTNSMPADAAGIGTPTYGALKGALQAATARQDAYPTHKVIVVLATDGDPNGCPKTVDDIADLAKSARNYNGVLTYVIGVAGSTIVNLDKIAAGGGTGKAIDITSDIGQFTDKVNEIRKAQLGCDFEIPPPPNSEQLDPNLVNFSYTPKGVGTPKVLLRADDLADCGSEPGWYFDSNAAPTKILLCPASCSTVQADNAAKVDVLFGCQSLIN